MLPLFELAKNDMVEPRSQPECLAMVAFTGDALSQLDALHPCLAASGQALGVGCTAESFGMGSSLR